MEMAFSHRTLHYVDIVLAKRKFDFFEVNTVLEPCEHKQFFRFINYCVCGG